MALSLALGACQAPAEEVVPESREVLEQTLRIGSLEGAEYPLERVIGLIPRPDGSVYVRQASATEIPMFDSNGTLVRILGRQGEGPGEFGTISELGLLGDTLWASDIRLRRTTFFAADGTHLSDISHELVDLGPAFYYPPPTLLAGEHAVTLPFVASAMAMEAVIPLLQTTRGGQIVDTLVLWDRSGQYAAGAAGEMPLRHPFVGGQLSAVSQSGAFFAVLEPVGAAAADSVSARLTLWSPSMDTVYRRTFRRRPAPIAESVVDDWFTDRAARQAGSDGDVETEVARLRARVDVPSHHAFGDDLLVSDAGEVWIQLGDATNPGRTWWTVNPDGVLTAAIEAPANVRLLSLEGQYAWGVETDDLGVSYVVRFSRGPAP